MKSLRWFLALAAVALVGGVAQAQNTKPAAASFSVLSAMETDKAQAEAKAWLTQAGKTDAATLQKFEAIWKQTNRTVLDRLAETFALGNADAAKLIADARNLAAPAPTAVPDLFKNEKLSPFFRSNLAVAYANLLTHRRVFEEALDVLKTTKASQVADPGAYLFCKAICEHGLLQKEEAKGTIDRLLADVPDVQERYKTVGVLMLLDMEMWKSKDLGAVARLMENSERMLKLARAGDKTKGVQKEIIYRLDELIKEMEKQAKDKDAMTATARPTRTAAPAPTAASPAAGAVKSPATSLATRAGPTRPARCRRASSPRTVARARLIWSSCARRWSSGATCRPTNASRSSSS